MHAETGGIAGALIPPASFSASGLGKTDLGPSVAPTSTALSIYKHLQALVCYEHR